MLSNIIKFEVIQGSFKSKIEFNLTNDKIIAITGLSGSGKSTIAKVICGLIKPNNGLIKINDKVLFCSNTKTNIAPNLRKIGMVFQEPRLFSHMTVKNNLLYGQRRNTELNHTKLAKIVSILGIKDILERKTYNLSGGEAQRVSIGRALLSEPEILILDEPLTGLDTPRQNKIMSIIKSINKKIKIPILFISHSIDEIMFIADKIIVIEKGKVAAQGAIDEIISYKKLSYFNKGNQKSSLIKGKIIEHDKEKFSSTIDVNGTLITTKKINDKVGSNHILKLFSKDISVATEAPKYISINNILETRINSIQIFKHKGSVDLKLRIGKQEIISEITLKSYKNLKLKKGLKVYALVKAISIVGK
jgi:molybdate transport system ATP-binding protein|tara:strand:- start:297 stop:1379 length:1083 start_codon:yes stop_codon:yes gene_type:complete